VQQQITLCIASHFLDKEQTMSQVIIHTNENGGVSVTVPTGEISIQAVKEKDTPSHSIIVDDSSLPNQHSDFFNAWELVDGKVEVNLSKAKEITKNRLRAEREPLLQAQDVAFQRALETGADTTAIVAEKQRLRDITSLADAESTLEGLRAIKV
jgi:predicted naringenin-chalcone synthase